MPIPVGTVVRIKTRAELIASGWKEEGFGDDANGHFYGGRGDDTIVPDMHKWLGKTLTVKRTHEGIRFSVEENVWGWSEGMIQTRKPIARRLPAWF